MEGRTCIVNAPKHLQSWWTESLMSSWRLDSTLSAQELFKNPSEQDRSLKDWIDIIQTTLSSHLADWELCSQVDISAYQPGLDDCVTPKITILGHIVQVDFRNDCATFRLTHSTKLSLLKSYEAILALRYSEEYSEEERIHLVQLFHKRLEELAVQVGCSILKYTTGVNGSGSFTSQDATEDLDDDDFDAPIGLDKTLGLGPYKGKGLAEIIGNMFAYDVQTDSLDCTELRDSLKSSPPSSPVKETRAQKISKLPKIIPPSLPSPIMPDSPTQLRKANIYEDERGGKRRRRSPTRANTSTQTNIIHTDPTKIEASMHKRRKTSPDCNSTDSGIGLLSSPGESPRGINRWSLTLGDYPFPSSSSPSSDITMGDASASSHVEEWRNKTLNHDNIDDDDEEEDIANEFYESDSSSDEENAYPMMLPFEPLCAVDRLRDTTKTAQTPPPPEPSSCLPLALVPLQQVTTPQQEMMSNRRKSYNKCRSWIAAKVAREVFVVDRENDYTDNSDLELDSDTPTVELLVDSEDEADHIGRKLRRRRRKALRKELGRKQFAHVF